MEAEERASSNGGRSASAAIGRALDLSGKTAIVVDDGIATGATARAACQVARALGAARIVLATPVAPPGLEHRLDDVADDFVCLDQPRSFAAVGQFYDNFDQTTDAQVVDALAR